ncbi:hypothetical protein [Chryseobacterium taichungense]|uniref:hypothetical protein n=1 Tax=Chryseobacterium taichungense TaxID=295069 RepID=UPI0028AA5C31|nr:hypothetical protein [Chryseobacterium taichungense]
MKTLNLSPNSFSKIGNEFIENVLKQLLSEHYLIIQIFYNEAGNSECARLVIVLEHSKDVKELQKQKWVKKAFVEYQIMVCFNYSTRVHRQYSLGHPFIELYCKPSALIYQNPDYGNLLHVKRDWKKFNKKFSTYKDSFFHDHNLLLSQASQFISENSSLSVVILFEKLFQYDLEYLENLYLGNTCDINDANKRIMNLSVYIPKIQKYFVKQNSDSYYLLALIEEVKRDSYDDDVMIYCDEMYEAFTIAEHSLFCLIKKQLDNFKNLIKSSFAEKRNTDSPVITDSTNQRDEALDVAVETIVSAGELEEIYLFHKVVYGERTTYYLLLIGFNISNDFLRNIRHKIRDRSTETNDYVLIAHDRQWIQKSLTIQQPFFVNIIQEKNKIYESNPYHPEPHWQSFYDTSNYLSLLSYCKSTEGSAKQFWGITKNKEENYQGLPYIFSLFFLSFCRTYIFTKLCYEPHYLPSHFLWKLCLYANPELKRHEYLFDEFRLKFFSFLDHNRKLHDRLDYFEKEDIEKMKAIVEKLMDELYELVAGRGLISKIEENETAE